MIPIFYIFSISAISASSITMSYNFDKCVFKFGEIYKYIILYICDTYTSTAFCCFSTSKISLFLSSLQIDSFVPAVTTNHIRHVNFYVSSVEWSLSLKVAFLRVVSGFVCKVLPKWLVLQEMPCIFCEKEHELTTISILSQAGVQMRESSVSTGINTLNSPLSPPASLPNTHPSENESKDLWRSQRTNNHGGMLSY